MITESAIYWITRMYFLHGLALAVSIVFVVLTLAWLVVSAICHLGIGYGGGFYTYNQRNMCYQSYPRYCQQRTSTGNAQQGT